MTVNSSTKTSDGTGPVLCPICLERVNLSQEKTLYRRDAGRYVPLNLDGVRSELKKEDMKRGAWRKCPGVVREPNTPHYLPADYATQGPPLVIGFVGASGNGKSHLLAAMIGEMENKELASLELEVTPLDPAWHQVYMHEKVYPFFEESRRIRRTEQIRDADTDVMFADAFLVRGPFGTRAVAFFDVAGGDLQEGSTTTEFMLAVDALIFVVDPHRTQEGPLPERSMRGDPTFATVLNRLRAKARAGAEPAETLPAAIAITKSDRCQFEMPALTWLRKPGLAAYRRFENPDLEAVQQESRDAYGFLYKRGLQAWLEPVNYFHRITLHFVSATGSSREDANRETYSLGVRPRRVLDPLVAILGMTGMLGPSAAEVGH